MVAAEKDIATNTEATVRRVFAFLGLDSSIELPALKSVQPEDVVDLVVTSEKKAGGGGGRIAYTPSWSEISGPVAGGVACLA